MARELAFFLSLNAGPDGGRRRFRGAGIVPRKHFRVMASAFPTCRLCAASAFPECAQPRAHVRLQDVPLTNRRPDIVVYRADTIDVTPTRPEDVLLAAEIVSPGSETTDRVVKLDQYARAGIPFYWRVELTATGIPVVYTYLNDSASRRYRDGEVFTGLVKATVPFPVEIDLSTIA